jgi:hypothetical protein
MSEKRRKTSQCVEKTLLQLGELEPRLMGDDSLICDPLRSTATVYGVILSKLFRSRRVLGSIQNGHAARHLALP